jgi:hypothetical protein
MAIVALIQLLNTTFCLDKYRFKKPIGDKKPLLF